MESPKPLTLKRNKNCAILPPTGRQTKMPRDSGDKVYTGITQCLPVATDVNHQSNP